MASLRYGPRPEPSWTLLGAARGARLWLPACSSDATTGSWSTAAAPRTWSARSSSSSPRRPGSAIDVRYGDSADLALLIDEEGDADARRRVHLAEPRRGRLPRRAGPADRLPDESSSLVAEGDAGRRRLGRPVGPGAHARLQHRPGRPEPTCPTRCSTSPRRVRRRGGGGPHERLVPGLRDRDADELGEDEARAWLDGMAAGDPPTFATTPPSSRPSAGARCRWASSTTTTLPGKAEDPDLPVENHFFPDGDLGSTADRHRGVVVEGSDRRRGPAARRVPAAEEAQRFFTEETFEYPLAAGVDAQPGAPAARRDRHHRHRPRRAGRRPRADDRADRDESGLNRADPLRRPGRRCSSRVGRGALFAPRSSTWRGARIIGRRVAGRAVHVAGDARPAAQHAGPGGRHGGCRRPWSAPGWPG